MQKQSINSAFYTQLVESITSIKQNQFRPKPVDAIEPPATSVATSRVLFDPIKSNKSNTYRTGMGDTPVYIRPGALDFKALPSRGHRC